MGLFDKFKEVLKAGSPEQKIIKIAGLVQTFADKLDLEDGDETMEIISLCIENIKNAPDLKSAKLIRRELLIELVKRGIKVSPEDLEEDEGDSSDSDD